MKALLLLLCLCAMPAAAQWRQPVQPAEPTGSGTVAPAPEEDGNLPEMVFVGAAAGVVGFFGGGVVTLYAWDALGGCALVVCGLRAAAAGAALGTTLLLPLGVHAGNQRRGSYSRALLASTVVAAGGLLLAGAATAMTPGDAGPLLLAMPVAQLAAAIVAERHAERRRTR